MCSKGGEEHGDSSFPEPTVQTNLLNMGLMAAIIEGCQLPHPCDLKDADAKVVLTKVRNYRRDNQIHWTSLRGGKWCRRRRETAQEAECKMPAKSALLMSAAGTMARPGMATPMTMRTQAATVPGMTT